MPHCSALKMLSDDDLILILSRNSEREAVAVFWIMANFSYSTVRCLTSLLESINATPICTPGLSNEIVCGDREVGIASFN